MHHSAAHTGSHSRIQHASVSTRSTHRGTRVASSRHHAHVIQCVAYAKTASDVMLRGNARDWWHNAAGVYDRGQAPEAGSVLNFRGTRRMPLGHVAVVRNVIDNRTITIDQSHWAQAGVSRNVAVIDVSPNNDWSAVRVALNSGSGNYGSIYPTYGFIYPRHEGSGPSLRQTVMTAWDKKATATQLAQAPATATPAAAEQEAAAETAAAPQNDGAVSFGSEE
ncbi:CHAP domain-containing protein [Acetobacter sp. TBRC 12305]|uniref:CHAP domain-containing protein n=1 Tax=Acetobacter garciniae TaxID=2817435 RepID=A0A939KRS1_9PROT|nr:CHAP domain-containing protein [Acetobacter garciniae]MBX0345235.1 CHAP domain-containing protein [Acetobacter garciniae]